MSELQNDLMAMLNARNFIEELLTASDRVECGGAGIWVDPCHGPEADLEVTIDGFPFSIIIKAKPLPAPPDSEER